MALFMAYSTVFIMKTSNAISVIWALAGIKLKLVKLRMFFWRYGDPLVHWIGKFSYTCSDSAEIFGTLRIVGEKTIQTENFLKFSELLITVP
jgi:hypothetical protein